MPSNPQWAQLMRNCCPFCQQDLLKKQTGMECSFRLCPFFISTAKFDALKESLRRQHFGAKLRNERRYRKLSVAS